MLKCPSVSWGSVTKGHRALPAKWTPGLGRTDHYEALIEDGGTIAITQRLRAITSPPRQPFSRGASIRLPQEGAHTSGDPDLRPDVPQENKSRFTDPGDSSRRPVSAGAASSAGGASRLLAAFAPNQPATTVAGQRPSSKV